MKVEFSPGAQDDLNRISEHIAMDNPMAAERFVTDVERLSTTLRTFPDRGSHLEGWHGTRRLLLGKYLILYRVGSDTIEILRILHAAMDIDTVLARDDRA